MKWNSKKERKRIYERKLELSEWNEIRTNAYKYDVKIIKKKERKAKDKWMTRRERKHIWIKEWRRYILYEKKAYINKIMEKRTYRWREKGERNIYEWIKDEKEAYMNRLYEWKMKNRTNIWINKRCKQSIYE